MASTMNRRALIGGVGIAAVTLAAPAIGSISPSNSEWSALVAAYQQADARMIAVGAEHARCEDAYAASRAQLGEKPTEPAWPALPRRRNDMTVAELYAFADEQAVTPGQLRYKADLAAWEARAEALEKRIMGDIEARWEESVTAQGDAENKMLAYPAPDAAALAYKMAVIERSYRGCDLDGKVMSHVFTDARRLLKMEA